MEFLLSEEDIMVLGEGDVVEAAMKELQERLRDWDWYDVEKTDRTYPILSNSGARSIPASTRILQGA